MNSRCHVSIAVCALLVAGRCLLPLSAVGADDARSYSPFPVPLMPIPGVASAYGGSASSVPSPADYSEWIFPGRFRSAPVENSGVGRAPWLAYRDGGTPYSAEPRGSASGYPEAAFGRSLGGLPPSPGPYTYSGGVPANYVGYPNAMSAVGVLPDRWQSGQRPAFYLSGSAPRANAEPDTSSSVLTRSSGVSESFQSRRRQSAPSPAMRAVADQADDLIRHGVLLAARRAEYAARAEFTDALELVAQALDAETGGNYYSQSLAAGLRALREADDFATRGIQLAADMDLSGLVASHRTPVLKQVPADELTPLVARQRYYTYALEQLAQAGGEVPSASLALYGLGKVYAAWSADVSRDRLTNAPKAMAAYHAALLVDARNHLAANELGVLFAQFGQLQEARAVLRHGASIYPLPETWRNLAAVHERLGEFELARMAGAQGQQLARLAVGERLPVPLVWVTPQQFAQLSPPPANVDVSPASPSSTMPASAAKSWRQTSALEVTRPASTTAEMNSIQLCRADEDVPAGRPTPGTYPATSGVMLPVGPVVGSLPARPGEYVGPARGEHVSEYRLRVDDQLDFVYRVTREQSKDPYRLNVGDVVAIEFLNDSKMDRGDVRSGQGLVIQPDGTITLHLLGQVNAARLTVPELQQALIAQYSKFYRDPGPQIIVTPLRVNAKLEDLRAAVDSRYGEGGQTRRVQVTPEGTISLPAIGTVAAQGLTLTEVKKEVDEKYRRDVVVGIEVTPILRERAPRYIYVVGEVRQAGRFVLEGPTTVMQAIALAGGWNNGGNLHEVVVFRRGEDWQLMATKLDIRGALFGKTASPADEIWLRDSDLVIVPKAPIKETNDAIEQIFTRGIYGVLPLQYGVNVRGASLL